jgi:A/G-specific adenine glycosylase
LLGGMTEFPGTPWRGDPWTDAEAVGAHAPMPGVAWRRAGEVMHVFTHFALTLTVLAGAAPTVAADGFLSPIDTLADQALPSVMRKCAAIARKGPPRGRSSVR